MEAQVSGEHRIEIWGDGEQTRSFMYIDDCLEGICRIMDSDVREPLNLGSSELVSINELVSLVEEIAGLRMERFYDPGAPIGVAGRNSDNTRIREALGWEPGIGLREGMERTYKWVHDEYARRYGGRLGPRSAAPRGAHLPQGRGPRRPKA